MEAKLAERAQSPDSDSEPGQRANPRALMTLGATLRCNNEPRPRRDEAAEEARHFLLRSIHTCGPFALFPENFGPNDLSRCVFIASKQPAPSPRCESTSSASQRGVDRHSCGVTKPTIARLPLTWGQESAQRMQLGRHVEAKHGVRSRAVTWETALTDNPGGD